MDRFFGNGDIISFIVRKKELNPYLDINYANFTFK